MLLSCVVKWFDSTRGFGFLLADDGEGDILLHANALRAFGVSSVAEGWRIEASVETSERGRRRVAKVHGVQRPAGTEEPPPDAGPLQPARVKWFSREKGYGFVNVFRSREDVYLHMATRRDFGMGAVAEGSALVVRVTMGPKGLTACEVRDWDYVT